MARKFINGKTISTTKYGNVYETTMLDKYGRLLKSRISFDAVSAEHTHNNFISDAYDGK